MTDFVTKRALGSETTNYALFVADTYLEEDSILNNNAGTYSPAVGDVLCYDTGDSDKHKRYDAAIGTVVILGIVSAITVDQTTPTAVEAIKFATNATVRYASLGTDNVDTAPEKLALQNALRAKNINTED